MDNRKNITPRYTPLATARVIEAAERELSHERLNRADLGGNALQPLNRRAKLAPFQGVRSSSNQVSGAEFHGVSELNGPWFDDGEKPLLSVYASSPGRLVSEDVSGNQAGSVAAFRSAVIACRSLGRGDDQEYSVAFGNGGATTTFTAVNYTSPTYRSFVGWRLRLAFIEDQRQVPTITISTTNHVDGAGGAISRSFSFAFEGESASREYSLFIPAVSSGVLGISTATGRFAPFPGLFAGAAVAAVGIGGASTFSVTGLVAGAGTAYLSWLHPDHSALPEILTSIAAL